MRISLVTETFPPEINGVALTNDRLGGSQWQIWAGIAAAARGVTTAAPWESVVAKFEQVLLVQSSVGGAGQFVQPKFEVNRC